VLEAPRQPLAHEKLAVSRRVILSTYPRRPLAFALHYCEDRSGIAPRELSVSWSWQEEQSLHGAELNLALEELRCQH
jgi:hypothetical protein